MAVRRHGFTITIVLALLSIFITSHGDDSLEQQLYLRLHTHRQLEALLDRPTIPRYPHWSSPSNGTNILRDTISLIRCPNQTQCIHPAFQLEIQYKVYLCRHINYGVRFFYLVREGLLLHPNVIMVNQIDQSDLIVYLPGSSDWSKSECSANRQLNSSLFFIW